MSANAIASHLKKVLLGFDLISEIVLKDFNADACRILCRDAESMEHSFLLIDVMEYLKVEIEVVRAQLLALLGKHEHLHNCSIARESGTVSA